MKNRQTVIPPLKSFASRVAQSGKTMADFAAMTDNDILRLPKIGRRSLYTIRAELARDVSPRAIAVTPC